jgi:hypothetical protein
MHVSAIHVHHFRTSTRWLLTYRTVADHSGVRHSTDKRDVQEIRLHLCEAWDDSRPRLKFGVVTSGGVMKRKVISCLTNGHVVS